MQNKYVYSTRINLVSYQVSMSPATNPTDTACCCGNCGRRIVKLVVFVISMFPPQQQQQQRAGQHTLIMRNYAKEKYKSTYRETRQKCTITTWSCIILVAHQVAMNQRFYKPYCRCLLLLLLQLPLTSHEACRVRYQYGSAPAAAAKRGSTHACRAKLQSGRRSNHLSRNQMKKARCVTLPGNVSNVDG